MAIAPRLDEDIDDISVLVDSPPEILPLALDRHKELVQVPGVAQATFPPLELSSVLRPELPTPLANGFVGDDDPPLGEEILDVSEAQTESVVEPDRVADDFLRESVSEVVWRSRAHRGSLPRTTSTCQYQLLGYATNGSCSLPAQP